jgi:hypothetical protein
MDAAVFAHTVASAYLHTYRHSPEQSNIETEALIVTGCVMYKLESSTEYSQQLQFAHL